MAVQPVIPSRRIAEQHGVYLIPCLILFPVQRFVNAVGPVDDKEGQHLRLLFRNAELLHKRRDQPGALPLIDLVYHIARDRLVVEDDLILRELRDPVADREEGFICLERGGAVGSEKSWGLVQIRIEIGRAVLRQLQRIEQKLIQYFRERLLVEIVGRARDFRPAADVRDGDLLKVFLSQRVQKRVFDHIPRIEGAPVCFSCFFFFSGSCCHMLHLTCNSSARLIPDG